tara:strand:+ start:180 stop:449 length:270 start_codon:yes stop_codon:yes gene_type:complete
MKKTIKIKINVNSSKRNTDVREYYFDDVQVSELEYYELNHLLNSEIEDLRIALKECKSQEPADSRLFQDWSIQCSLIEELIAKKVGFIF